MLALRLTYTDKASLDMTGREYFVSKVGSGTSGGHDNIVRLDAALTVRIYRQHAVSIRYLGNRRDASFDGSPTGKQVRNTVGLFYTLLGQDRFGGADWALTRAWCARRRAQGTELAVGQVHVGRSAGPGSRRG